jgi:hypothetical protein
MTEADLAAVLVVLRAQEGEHEADPEAAARVRRAMADAGFRLGPLVGISFAAEGSRERVESTFPRFRELQGTGAELSLERLPDDVTPYIRAVVSEAPPDFGPTSY